jgi:multisubunit Na+/H+ antiporter MnhF subunit
MGSLSLTWHDKIGYNTSMAGGIISFVLRMTLVVTLCLFVWRFVKPRTQLMRVLRAELLVLTLLGILVVLRIAGAN